MKQREQKERKTSMTETGNRKKNRRIKDASTRIARILRESLIATKLEETSAGRTTIAATIIIITKNKTLRT